MTVMLTSVLLAESMSATVFWCKELEVSPAEASTYPLLFLLMLLGEVLVLDRGRDETLLQYHGVGEATLGFRRSGSLDGSWE